MKTSSIIRHIVDENARILFFTSSNAKCRKKRFPAKKRRASLGATLWMVKLEKYADDKVLCAICVMEKSAVYGRMLKWYLLFL
jgi:hypothetical protein